MQARSRSFWIFQAATLAFCAACTSEEAPPKGAGGNAPTESRHDQISRYVEGEREALCEVFTNCCSEAEREFGNRFDILILAAPNVTTKEACLAEIAKLAPTSAVVGAIESSLDAGRGTWDPSKIDACIAEWSKCHIPIDSRAGHIGERCQSRPFTPTGKLGDACTTTADCAEGGCMGPLGKRTCAPLPKPGEPCADIDGAPLGCADDSFCDQGTTTCTMLGAKGDACTTHHQCATGECHGKPFETGACTEPTLCDGNTKNDADVALGVCSDSSIGIDCTLVTANAWECTCTPSSGPTTTCETPFDHAQTQNGDTCAVVNCCPN